MISDSCKCKSCRFWKVPTNYWGSGICKNGECSFYNCERWHNDYCWCHKPIMATDQRIEEANKAINAGQEKP